MRLLISRRWRSCVICGNRTRSLRRIGLLGNPVWGYTPWAVCGDRCDTLARLLPASTLLARIDARAPLDDIVPCPEKQD